MTDAESPELPALWANICQRVGLEVEQISPALHMPEGPIFCITLTLTEAAFARDRILQERHAAALWPVLLGTEADLELHRETLGYADQAPPLHLMLQEADHLHLRLERGESFADLLEEDEPSQDGARIRMSGYQKETTLEEISYSREQVAPEPLTAYAHRLLSVPDALDPSQRAVLALCPQPQGWQIPTMLRIGGYNDNPTPWEHAAMLRYWQEVWEANVVAVTPSRVELLASRRPTSWEEAFELAQEHVDYCPDLIRYGGVNLRDLATKLRQDPLWSFWWS